MSQQTTGIQRTATQRVPTRTVAGSYEAPVEGIVDYGAFQRGFESTFQMPEKEEDKFVTLETPESKIEREQGVEFNVPQSAVNTLNTNTAEQLKILRKKYTVNVNDPNAKDKINEGQKVVNHYLEASKGATIMLEEFADKFSISNYNRLGQPIESTTISGDKVSLHPIQVQEALKSGRANVGIGQDDLGNEVGGLFVKVPNVKKQYKATSEELKEITKQGLTLDPFKTSFETKKPLGVSQKFAESQKGLTSEIEKSLIGTKNLKANLQSSLVFIPTENFKDVADFNLKYTPPKANIGLNLDSAIEEINGLKLNLSADGDFFEDDTSIGYLNTSTNKVVTSDTDTKILNAKGYAQIDVKAAAAAREILGQVKYADNKNAVVLDAVFGEGDNKIVEGSPLSNRLLAKYGEKKEIKNKEGQVVRVEYNNPKITLGGVDYDLNLLNKVGENGIIGGDIPQSVRSFISKEYVEDQYKILYGSDGYHDDGNGVAVTTYAKDVDKKLTTRPDLTALRIGEGAGQFLTQMGIRATDGTLNRANIMNQKQWFASTDTQREDYIRNLNTIASPESGSRFLDKDQAKQAFYESNSELETEEIDKLWKDKINQFSEKVGGKLVEPVIWNIKGNDLKGVDFGYSPTGAFSIALDAAGITGEKRLQYLSEVKKQLANNDYN